MSVINETLDNLKQSKKRPLSPASSFYNEKVLKTETVPLMKRSYIIPCSFAILVALLFYVSHLFFSRNAQQQDVTVGQASHSSWFKSNLQANQQQNNGTQKNKTHSDVGQNIDAQNMYYSAMALLNEGKEDEALQGLKTILAQYPNFVPAQKVYSMLVTH